MGKLYQKAVQAEKELEQCDPSEDATAATEGQQSTGPPGGYKVELRDVATLRIGFVSSWRVMFGRSTESLPVGICLRRPKCWWPRREGLRHCETKKHQAIPFTDDAGEHLLGCQFE